MAELEDGEIEDGEIEDHSPSLAVARKRVEPLDDNHADLNSLPQQNEGRRARKRRKAQERKAQQQPQRQQPGYVQQAAAQQAQHRQQGTAAASAAAFLNIYTEVRNNK